MFPVLERATGGTVMAPGQVGELGVQRGGPPRIVPDAPVGDDGRPVVGFEVVTEVFRVGRADSGRSAPGPDVGDPVAEQLPDVVFLAPQRWREGAGRGWGHQGFIAANIVRRTLRVSS